MEWSVTGVQLPMVVRLARFLSSLKKSNFNHFVSSLFLAFYYGELGAAGQVERRGGGKEKEKEKEDTKPRILLSGMESSQRKQMAEIVERLEGSLTEEPGQATHLVMPRLSRTNNFLLCLPTIKFVLKVIL